MRERRAICIMWQQNETLGFKTKSTEKPKSYVASDRQSSFGHFSVKFVFCKPYVNPEN